LDIAGAVFPAERVSGDYFDYLTPDDLRVGLVVADVSGHGLGPALVMAQVQAYLRALADDCDDPGEILTGVNRLFALRDGGRFVTLFLAFLDMKTRTLHYAGAGHQAYLLDAAGNTRVLSATGLPLGVKQSEEIPTSSPIPLQPGQILLLTTDGYEESLGPDQRLFGRRRALDILRAHRVRPAAELVQLLHAAVCDFAQQVPQGDDITLVVAKS
jgi:sigma-B regulation protein RsbU (phosphoserine phosphatase)